MLVLLYFQRFSHAQRVQFCCFIYMYIFLFFSCCFASAACYRVSVLRAPLCFTSRRPFFIHKQNECGVSDRDTLTNDRDGDSKTARVLRERERQRELAQSSWETCVCVCVCCYCVCVGRVFCVHVQVWELCVSVFSWLVCLYALPLLCFLCVCLCESVFVTSTSMRRVEWAKHTQRTQWKNWRDGNSGGDNDDARKYLIKTKKVFNLNWLVYAKCTYTARTYTSVSIFFASLLAAIYIAQYTPQRPHNNNNNTQLPSLVARWFDFFFSFLF